MTADDFRELALGFPGAIESAHMNHPDFRAHGRIFATLGYPDTTRGMVKLDPQDQKHFVDLHPEIFTPVKGAWGLQGSTSVLLAAAKPEILTKALDLAWQNSANAPAAKTKSNTKTKTDRSSSKARV